MKEEQSAVTTKEMQDAAHQPGHSYQCCEPSKAVFHLD